MGIDDQVLNANTPISFDQASKYAHQERNDFLQDELLKKECVDEIQVRNLELQYQHYIQLLKDYVMWRGSILSSMGAKSPAVELCLNELDKLRNLSSALVLNL